MNASVPLHPALVGDRLLYVCLGASLLLHVFALLTAAPVPTRETPPLRLTATLRTLEPAPPSAPAPPAAPAPSLVPEPQKASAPEPQKVPPKPIPEVRRPEPRPQVAPAPEQRLVKPLPEERADSRPAPTIAAPVPTPAPAPAPAPTAAAAADAKAEAKAEARADAPKIASAAPSTAAATGTSGSSEDVKLALGLFQDKLVSIIETRRYKRYPNEAMQNGWEGTAWVEILVGSDGKTRGINLHKSSGHEMLDKEARVAVEKARVEAMMQMPPALKGREFVAQIRVVFRLP